MASYSSDFSQFKQVENREDLGFKILDQSSEGVIITNQRREIIYVNTAFTKTTGYTPGEVIGHNPRILKSGVHDMKFYRNLWIQLSKTGNWSGEIWNKRKTGEIYLEWLSIQTIKDQKGHISNFVATFWDITEQEQLRKDVIQTGQIQRRLLPPDLEDSKLTIRTIYTPVRYVSGDFFDFRWNKDMTILYGYLFDVMGHGLATALQSASLRVLFEQIFFLDDIHLHEKLTWINQQVFELFSEDTFAAAICFSFDFQQNTFTCRSAGITLFFTQDRKRYVKKVMMYGSFLGLLQEPSFQSVTFPLQAGDSFYFISDGLLDILPLIDEKKLSVSLFKQIQWMIAETENKDDISAVWVKVRELTSK